MRRLLVLFAREPAAGRVKTRLAAAIGAERAAALYAAFITDLGSALGSTGEWRPRVASADGTPAPGLVALLPGWEIVPQRSGDLGDRLANAFVAAWDERFDAAAIAGSDAPLLATEDVRGAFGELERGADAAFSPAPDGGFTLVALRADVDAASIFSAVRWSTENALADTRANAAALGLRVALLPEVPDVDVPGDLRTLRERLAADPGAAPATARLLLTWEAA